MSLQLPLQSKSFGFVNSPVGTHSSRTIMLSELRLLLAALGKAADLDEYRSAIIDENVLLKRSVATRKESFRRLRELYALNEGILLFRALRDLWDEDVEAQPILALLCAVARDPLLKCTAELILSTPIGMTITPQMISEAVNVAFPDRYSQKVLAGIGRHIASSWQQAGLLGGKLHKVRTKGHSHSATVAYALLLSYLLDARGEALFHTFWCRLLDVPLHVLREEAILASQLGWIEYRHMGDVTDVGFRYLLRK